jgi:uncharacterized protein
VIISLISYILLGASICAVWFKPIELGEWQLPPWIIIYAAALPAALATGTIEAPALFALVALLGVSWAARAGRGKSRTALVVLAALGALVLSLHAAPGFNNLKWLTAIKLTSDAVPFTLTVNFDKGSAGLFLFALLAPHITSFSELRAIWRPMLTLAVGTAFVVILTAMGVGYTRFEPKLPPETAGFLLVNLFFTCFAEEAFFRGILQEGLHRLAQRTSLAWINYVAILLSALIFGAVHSGGGTQYILLASLGGFGNAITYARTRKVEASIFTHFMLNASHFLFFTYPALAK